MMMTHSIRTVPPATMMQTTRDKLSQRTTEKARLGAMVVGDAVEASTGTGALVSGRELHVGCMVTVGVAVGDDVGAWDGVTSTS